MGQHRHQGLFRKNQRKGGNGERELLTETSKDTSVLLDVYLPTWVPEPKLSAGENRDRAAFIFILVKSAICESKKVAQAALPTRGVPNVTLSKKK